MALLQALRLRPYPSLLMRGWTMCFEFEWLYWAQLAQEEEQRRAAAGQVEERQQAAAAVRAQPSPAQEPAHA
jgi:hypothetical protein